MKLVFPVHKTGSGFQAKNSSRPTHLTLVVTNLKTDVPMAVLRFQSTRVTLTHNNRVVFSAQLIELPMLPTIVKLDKPLEIEPGDVLRLSADRDSGSDAELCVFDQR